jgi:hypothetical protein
MSNKNAFQLLLNKTLSAQSLHTVISCTCSMTLQIKITYKVSEKQLTLLLQSVSNM